jgi:hypothetical protein
VGRYGLGRIGRRSPGGRHFRQTEVENLDRSIGPDQDVVGLEIAVHDPHGVSGGEAVGDLHRHIEELTRALCLANGRAVNKLHDKIVRPHVVQLTDVGMIQRGYGAGFALETV